MFYIVSTSSHGMHRGGFFPSIKRSESYTYYKWPMRSREKTVSSLLLARGQETEPFSFGMIIMQQMVTQSSHPSRHSSKRHLFRRDFKSEKGMCSSKRSPWRISLAAESASAAEFPLMPVWPGTETKTITFSPLVILSTVPQAECLC